MFRPFPRIGPGEPVTLQTEGDEGERASIIPADELTGLPVVQLSDDKIAELVIARLTRWYASGRAIGRPNDLSVPPSARHADRRLRGGPRFRGRVTPQRTSVFDLMSVVNGCWQRPRFVARERTRGPDTIAIMVEEGKPAPEFTYSPRTREPAFRSPSFAANPSSLYFYPRDDTPRSIISQ
jgi:hypothetical protein